MATARGVKSTGSAIIGSALVLSIASLLLLVACGESPAPPGGENAMPPAIAGTADYNCVGQDKENADRTAIEAYNYGRAIGLGIAQLNATEMNRLEQDYNRLTPACQRYVDSIGERLNEMVEAGRIRDQIDKLPW